MIRLERHIEVLLLSHDCVIVPDLGGFMAHHVEARYDEEENLFLPPLRTIGFNPQLKLNDSLLVQSYIEAYDLSYPEALRQIEDEVEELKQFLSNEGGYYLKDIGLLSLNAEGVYTFEPCEAGILTPALYALSSFEMPLLTSVLQPSAVVGELSAADNSEKAVIVPIDSSDTVEVDEEDDDRVIKIKLSWIRNAVAVAAVIAAFFFITPLISNYSIGTSDNKVVSVTKGDMGSEYIKTLVESVAVSDEPSISSETTPLEVKAETPSEEQPTSPAAQVVGEKPAASAAPVVGEKPVVPAAPVVEKQKSADSYCIVLASKISRKNAEAYVEMLHKKGFRDTHIYVNENNIVRVVYGNYSSETEAYNEKRQYSGTSDFRNAWVLKK